MSRELPVGTIKMYNQVAFRKEADKKWRPVPQGHPLTKEHNLNGSNIEALQNPINTGKADDETTRHLANTLHNYVERNNLRNGTADVHKIANETGYHVEQINGMLNNPNFKQYKMNIKDAVTPSGNKPGAPGSSAATIMQTTEFRKIKGILTYKKK